MRDPSGLYTPFDGIAPDSSASGFSYRSLGLPAIVACYFEGTTSGLAFPDEPPGDIEFLLKPLRQFPANRLQSKTIGPQDPPDPFSAEAFLDTLVSYTSQSLALGWIADQSTADKYEGHFSTAQTELQQADTTAARSELQTVLQEVAQDSGNVLTGEAYALLRFNTEYLLDQLPVTSVTVTVETVRDDLQDLIDADPGSPLADKLEDARDKLNSALSKLDANDVQGALGEIEGAVGDIQATVDDGLLDSVTGNQFMDDLAGAARALAVEAIDDAIARSGDPSKISDAQTALADGDVDRANLMFKDAVANYKDAVSQAEGA